MPCAPFYPFALGICPGKFWRPHKYVIIAITKHVCLSSSEISGMCPGFLVEIWVSFVSITAKGLYEKIPFEPLWNPWCFKHVFFKGGGSKQQAAPLHPPPLGCGISEDQPLPMMRQLELWVQVPSWSLKQSNRQTGVYKRTAPQNQIQTQISCSIIFRIALMFELFWVYLYRV